MALHLINASLTPLQLLKGDIPQQVPPPREVPTTPVANERRSANYEPTSWSHKFLQSLKIDQMDEEYKKLKAKKLKEEVRGMINDEGGEVLTKLELINDIQRLGLGYHFEKDIRKALHRFISSKEETSLHATALRFRLLRQHGYQVSQEVFKHFVDDNGGFERGVQDDIEGMLSLYEAAYLALEGEDLLDKALLFTTEHLKDFQGKMENDSGIAEHVSHSLELPVHRRTSRLEARWFIEALGKSNYVNSKLLELAKLDFNLVQSVFQRDLRDLSMWWKNLGLSNKLSFARDRLMECFFWTVGMVFEPQFQQCRKGLTKVGSFITIIDDIYDVYGTLDELEQFTNAVERWDIGAVADLPDYMRLCFLALYNTINEMAYDTLKEQGENIIPYLTKAWSDMCKTFLQEAKWSHGKCIPTFEEYLENGWRSVSGVLILTHTYFLLGQTISKQALECLENCHQLLRSSSMIFRLCNDMGTSSAEIERGESANSITCYMNETGCCEEVARAHLSGLIDKEWKKLNKIRVDDDSPFGKIFVETTINLARISQCTYQYGDAHGAPDVTSKNQVRSLIIEPISLA
ncbi:terpene synthase [Tripterygium wilfordii]|uniref:Terpene synthase n=1 Tax=Tripterygium wilfordii TaxID=458696 RepID=A0A7J7D552_TRIWF|nr:terpene synthase [Tripterygium wilfordii]QGX02118.1 sesquiterpene synthase 4 [Tripterygium wilfordii]